MRLHIGGKVADRRSGKERSSVISVSIPVWLHIAFFSKTTS